MNLIVHYQMESLRENLDKLVEKTLAMEDPTDRRLQSQPMYDSNSSVDYSEEVQEMSQTQPEKAKISRQQIKLLIDTRSDIQLLESNILPPELNLKIFCLTSPTLELAKMTFIMKILSWITTC